eukprot:773346-Prymnesium_polylepis.1
MHLRVDRGAQLSAARMAELACYDNTSWICWVIEMQLGPSSETLWHSSDSGGRTFLDVIEMNYIVV